MSMPVLFDIPGPKARARIRIGTVIGGLLVVAIVVLVLLRLAGNEQLDPQRWAILFDTRTGVPQGKIVRDQLERAKAEGSKRSFIRLAGSVDGPGDLSSRKGFSRK